MRELTVAMVMTKDPVAVTPDAGCKEIARTISKHQIGAVPVVGRDGVPIGVVASEDLIGGHDRPGTAPDDRAGPRGGRQRIGELRGA
ncbi:CBS domain-containing protein [Kibdelosporangium aridum]|uniref:CBS domain-containing protein n=1 Tax=Kibdelosporangium aridum TaxID=2030 RepID=UPI0035E5FF28